MSPERVIIAGGGAAGFFAAITLAESAPFAEVTLFEKGPHHLAKVRISGGGRCNVTHSCFDTRELSTRYPRGGKALISLFQHFQPHDTVRWFQHRGVQLKTEPDGRVFPTTDSSQTIIDCLVNAAAKAGVRTVVNRGVEHAHRSEDGTFEVVLSNAERVGCDRLLLATGGTRTPALAQLALELGHAIESPVPSLFTFHTEVPWLRDLAGIAVDAIVSAPDGLREHGPVLITHNGLSGPAILRLSAWGARPMHEAAYQFPLQINWLPDWDDHRLMNEFQSRRTAMPARYVANTPIAPIPARLWENLVQSAELPAQTRWASLSRVQQHMLVQHLLRAVVPVVGKSLNKDEFVTCGGVKLADVDLRTMQSRICHGLYFAGELLDIDGITGGFNFQAAWTTGFVAGHAIATDIRRLHLTTSAPTH